MIIYVSDFDLNGSGYMHISTNLCNELALRHDMGVIAIGMGYDGREHHWPYSIVPCPNLQTVPHMIGHIRNYGAPLEAVVVALDIPLQEALLKSIKLDGVPYVGIFPLEAPPLCMDWALELMKMDARLVMSRFGQDALQLANVQSEFIPIGVHDPQLWRPPTADERAQIRQSMGWGEDTFVILTVADNQERKNLAAAYEMVSRFAVDVQERNAQGYVTRKEVKRKASWQLVTRTDSPVGWKLQDLGMRHGILELTNLYSRGVPAKSLWAMFAGADAFLLTSKAEGLAIPVLEAMACKLPVIATDCGAMTEHLHGGRGLLIQPEYRYTDPFGNGDRYMAGIADGVKCLEHLEKYGPKELALEDACQYVAERTWDRAGAVLADAIRRVRKPNERQETLQTAEIPATPAIALG